MVMAEFSSAAHALADVAAPGIFIHRLKEVLGR